MRRARKVRITETAKIDLAEIWSYLAEESSEAIARRWLDRIEKRFLQLRSLPLSGAAREHLATNLRVVFFRKYAIYYLPHPEEVVIVRVLHGSRDIVSIADDGGFLI